jgi:excisionase family DNA binding protein
MVGVWCGLDNRHIVQSLDGNGGSVCTAGLSVGVEQPTGPIGSGPISGSAVRKGCTVAAQPTGKAATNAPRYLRAAEVAEILHVSPKTVSRWAKEGKLPFLRTLGGHRRYPAAEIRQLADQLQVQPTA